MLYAAGGIRTRARRITLLFALRAATAAGVTRSANSTSIIAQTSYQHGRRVPWWRHGGRDVKHRQTS